MAEKKETVLTVRVETESKSLSALKAEFKETQKALEGLDVSSSKYVETLQKLGGIRDEIGDLNAEINAFNPEGKVQAFGNVIGGLASGFQAAQGAAALFGAEGEQLQKTLVKVQAASALADGIKGVVGMGDAFKVLGNIIKTNPLFLLASILIGIGTALFALKDKIGFIGDAFDAITAVVEKSIQALKNFTDWMGITSFAAEDLAQKQIELAKKVGKETENRYSREIAFAKAAGKETIDLEIQKQAAFLATLKLQKAGIEEIKKAEDDLIVLQIQKRKQLDDANKKAAEEANKRTAKGVQEQNLIRRESLIKEGEQELEIRRTTVLKARDLEAELRRLDEIERLERRDAFLAINLEKEKAYVQSVQGITDALFSATLSNAEGNAKKQDEIRKKQFKVNKALGVSLAIIDGIGAVQNGLKLGGPPLAAVNAVLAAANVAKILATKYQGDAGGGEGGGSSSLGAGAGGVAIAPPSSGSTQLNADGTVNIPASQQAPTVKAIVTEVDITRTQRKINSIEEKAKIG